MTVVETLLFFDIAGYDRDDRVRAIYAFDRPDRSSARQRGNAVGFAKPKFAHLTWDQIASVRAAMLLIILGFPGGGFNDFI